MIDLGGKTEIREQLAPISLFSQLPDLYLHGQITPMSITFLGDKNRPKNTAVIIKTGKGQLSQFTVWRFLACV